MARCLELAAHGQGQVAPNPMVGAVIVCDGRIIGEGYHQRYGGSHAEVKAIERAGDTDLLRRSTLYVNLEPCSHYGKTPPCAELIIRKGIPRVVTACQDPFPEVSGRGIKMLRDAGIEVVTGIMEQEAEMLNRYFMTAHRKRRPYIILKWAQSADGYIDKIRADVSEQPVVFSNDMTKMMTHKLRSEVQAIMVGTNTAVLDNPLLTVKHWRGRSPLRIAADFNMRIPQDAKIFDGNAETLILKDIRYKILKNVKDELYNRQINSLLVEGGTKLHKSFINEGLWDEIVVETVPARLNQGVKAAAIQTENGLQLPDNKIIYPSDTKFIHNSRIDIFFNPNVFKKK